VLHRPSLEEKEVGVTEVGAEAPLSLRTEDRVEPQAAPLDPAAPSERLSAWFVTAILVAQLAWIGALAYGLARIFG
jgi:hypothetical protein